MFWSRQFIQKIDQDMSKIGTVYKGTFAKHRGTNSSSGEDRCFANAAFPKVENNAHTSPYLPIVIAIIKPLANACHHYVRRLPSHGYILLLCFNKSVKWYFYYIEGRRAPT